MDLACWNTGYLVDSRSQSLLAPLKKIEMDIHQNDALRWTKIDVVELVAESDTQDDDGVRPDVHIEQALRLSFRRQSGMQVHASAV